MCRFCPHPYSRALDNDEHITRLIPEAAYVGDRKSATLLVIEGYSHAQVDFQSYSISHMKGPNTEPWGTPQYMVRRRTALCPPNVDTIQVGPCYATKVRIK